MGKPYDEPKFQCNMCGKFFVKAELKEEANESIYCLKCYSKIIEIGGADL